MKDKIKLDLKMLVFTNGDRIYMIPFEMGLDLCLYINSHIKQGSFLHAVLCNDFMTACRCADYHNIGALPAYAHFLENFAPSDCYGSAEKVNAWIEQK